MTTPLAMPRTNVKPAKPTYPVRLAWTTSTGDRPLRPLPRGCPGCNGEISKSAAIRLSGCAACAA